MPRTWTTGPVNYGNGRLATPVDIVGAVNLAALSQDGSRPAKVTVGVAAVSLSPPTGFTPNYVLIYNSHTTAVVLADLNQDPALAAADPPSASQYGKGQIIPPGAASPIGLEGTVTTLRLLSNTDATIVWVCWMV